jgi:hypothetical protein
MPPYRMLDPGLAAAERLLAIVDSQQSLGLGRGPGTGRTSDPGPAPGLDLSRDPVLAALRRMLAALPDEATATAHLNRALAESGATPQLHRAADGWDLVFSAERDAGGQAQALVSLAVLVSIGGWRRVRRCSRCGAPYVDRTNGTTRRGCGGHPRRPV